MKVRIYQTADGNLRPDGHLRPDEIYDDVWMIAIVPDSGDPELKITDDGNKFHLAVDAQMLVEPGAANTINISARHSSKGD